MSYTGSVLVEGENVLYQGRIHWGIYLGEAMTASVSLLWVFAARCTQLPERLNLATFGFRPEALYPAYALAVVAALSLLRDFARYYATELVITNRRVIAKFGVVRRVSYEVLLDKVEGANISVTILGRCLGYGSVEVKGTGGRTAPVPYVAQPYRFQRELMCLLARGIERTDEVPSSPKRSRLRRYAAV